MPAKGRGRIRLSSDATSMKDINRKYVETIRRLEAGEIKSLEAKGMCGLLNGLRDAILRSEKRLPIGRNLKKKTEKKLKEWDKNAVS